VIVDVPHAVALGRLVAWDAPFLPQVSDVRRDGDTIRVVCAPFGAPLAVATRWPRGAREAVAAQLIATAAFLYERGWLPSRALLRNTRVSRGAEGVWLRLAGLPRHRLGDPCLERHLRHRPGAVEGMAATAVLPLLGAVVPERRREWSEALRRRRPWEASSALLEVLLGRTRHAAALRHPAGTGRVLWARRLAVPDAGVARIDEDALIAPVVGAALLRAAARDGRLTTVSGEFDEAEIARCQARAAAAGHDTLVLTTLAVPGEPFIELAREGEAAWALASEPDAAQAHVLAAVEVGRDRALLAGLVLAAGARNAFACRPRRVNVTGDAQRFASPAAREVLAWLRNAPAGLTAAELEILTDGANGGLDELERLRLVGHRKSRWHALVSAEASPERMRAIAARLPAPSVGGMVARAVADGDGAPLANWCAAMLDGGLAPAVRDAVTPLAAHPELSLLAAEAALALGRLAEAEGILERVPANRRSAEWHLLNAWRADQAGLPSLAAEALETCGGAELADRLQARRAYLLAEQARRAHRGVERQRLLEEAVRAAPAAVPEAGMTLAAAAGSGELRAWRRNLGAAWAGDLAARTYHLRGLEAQERGAVAAAATALRAALGSASGDDAKLLGEIHSDLGAAAILTDRPVVAERHLALAQRHLEACGSRRAVTIVQANRAVLACDRLEWREASELILASRALRGEVRDVAYWLEEAELARAELARGAFQAVEGRLPALEEQAREFNDRATLQESVAVLRGHLALVHGDFEGASAAAARAERGEAVLILAIVDGARGLDPAGGLPARWGMVATAAMLAAWRRGDRSLALERVVAAPPRLGLETAVGVARFAAILGRAEFPADDDWDALAGDASDTLEGAGLDGWAELLRSVSGGDDVRLLGALAAVLGAGSDALLAEHLRGLCFALRAKGIVITRRGVELARWGEEDATTAEVTVEEITVRVAGRPSRSGRKAMEAMAVFLATHLPSDGVPAARTGSPLIGTSAVMAALREEIERWGPLPANVLIVGEPGTGKELVASELHRASRRSGRFVAVNCAGLPGTLLEAELFGVVRGAFTGADRDRAGLVEAAERGTLFLDEVGELPLELQGKLLRLLQEREVRRVGSTVSRVVDVRFVAATNRDLDAAVAEGRFRRDLYHRIAVAVVVVPPLRERGEDVVELARRFVDLHADRFRRTGVRLAPAAATLLRKAGWPGNVRELDTVVQRAVAAARPGEALGPDRFPVLAQGAPTSPPALTWDEAVAAFRRQYFTALLEMCGGNRSEAARRAGISRQTLLYHLRALGIT
jgi:transcriptional regulator with AAA-type ATPase domain